MPANAIDQAAEKAKAGADDAVDTAASLAGAAERRFSEAAHRFERAVQDSIETIRAQSRTYADTAGEQIDEAQRYVVERVRERPLVSTAAALGIGLLLGLALAGGRR